MKKSEISNKWFFSDVPVWAKTLQIYIKGDALIITPFLIISSLFYFLNWKFALVITGVFYSLRQIGEMIYWLLQQFSKREYRPYDYGYKNLDNNAIYIIYQLRCLIGATAGISLLIYVLFFLN